MLIYEIDDYWTVHCSPCWPNRPFVYTAEPYARLEVRFCNGIRGRNRRRNVRLYRRVGDYRNYHNTDCVQTLVVHFRRAFSGIYRLPDDKVEGACNRLVRRKGRNDESLFDDIAFDLIEPDDHFVVHRHIRVNERWHGRRARPAFSVANGDRYISRLCGLVAWIKRFFLRIQNQNIQVKTQIDQLLFRFDHHRSWRVSSGYRCDACHCHIRTTWSLQRPLWKSRGLHF
jgi:hypothetical protein